MQGQNKAVEFTDIPNHSTLYIGSLGEVTRRADEVFGIPAFGHGQSQVGTLGRTFNGMALVYGAALKDLKLSLRGLSTPVAVPGPAGPTGATGSTGATGNMS